MMMSALRLLHVLGFRRGPRPRVLIPLLTFSLLAVGILTFWSRQHTEHSQRPPTPKTTATIQVDWGRFAYLQYATAPDHLCNSVMILASLAATGSMADRVLLYPQEWSTKHAEDNGNLIRRLLTAAKDKYGVKLEPVVIQHKANSDEGTWADGYTKLLSWNQTKYERVLFLDSDAFVLQSMDELFLLPSSPLALPRAYWLHPSERKQSAQVMLITPSTAEFERVQAAMAEGKPNDYDMEIVNSLYQDHALLLPHRPYNLLTGEFKSPPDKHFAYLGTDTEVWDGEKVLNETKYIHFSDWPIPKPWFKIQESVFRKHQPRCWNVDSANGTVTKGGNDCRDRDLWRGLYKDFAKKRKDICGLDFV